MSSARVVGVAAVLALSACSGDAGGAQEQTLTVLAAASLTDVLTLVAEDLEADHPGATVDLSFASSSTIVQQVSEGAPADVIALAGPGPLEQLPAELRLGDPVTFTTNSLELAVPPDNPAGITGVEGLTDEGIRLVLCQPQVPCGEATTALLGRLGIEPTVASEERDARATLTKVELGEADVGIVYRTDVAASHGWVSVAEVDPRDRELAQAAGTTRYTVARIPGGEIGPDAEAERAATDDFLELVTSDRGRRALENAGLAPLAQ